MANCVECGYLSVRQQRSGKVCEATERTRETGLVNIDDECFVANLFCFKNNPDFAVPVDEGSLDAILYPETRGEMRHSAEYAEQQLKRNLDCEHYCQWMPGRDPKEHEEMSLVQELDARTRQWRNEDIKQRQAFEALYEKRHQETRRDLKRTASIVAAVGFAASIIAAIIAAYFTAAPK